jgi:uncharacterized protein YuzE
MSGKQVKSGSELFIVDNSDQDWKVLRYLREWCGLAEGMDIATGYFEIGSLLALDGEWQKVDHIRILMGDEVSRRTNTAFTEGLEQVKCRLDGSLEAEKEKNDFLRGVPAIVEAIRNGKILAGYLYLPRQEGDRVAYSRKAEGGLVVDYTADGRAIGIEITSPSLLSIELLNKLLVELGQSPLSGKVLAPAG